jgi:hypothetical protein
MATQRRRQPASHGGHFRLARPSLIRSLIQQRSEASVHTTGNRQPRSRTPLNRGEPRPQTSKACGDCEPGDRIGARLGAWSSGLSFGLIRSRSRRFTGYRGPCVRAGRGRSRPVVAGGAQSSKACDMAACSGWRPCLSFCLIHLRPAPFTSDRLRHVLAGHGRWRPLANAGAHCWKACWGQPLRSSNLLSSATSDQAIRQAGHAFGLGLYGCVVSFVVSFVLRISV